VQTQVPQLLRPLLLQEYASSLKVLLTENSRKKIIFIRPFHYQTDANHLFGVCRAPCGVRLLGEKVLEKFIYGVYATPW
jgi:hypothetical protein